MSKIKSKDTKPELVLRKALYNKGIRYRKNFNKLPGSPDVVIMKYHIAIFVDGEFWHGYNWEDRKKDIHTNREYWISKIEKTMKRDLSNDEKLRQLGWIPIHFWENQIYCCLNDCINIICDFITYQTDGQYNE